MDLLHVAAVLSAILGVVSAWQAIRKARQDGEQSCHDRLTAAMDEAEHWRAELHAQRMG